MLGMDSQMQDGIRKVHPMVIGRYLKHSVKTATYEHGLEWS